MFGRSFFALTALSLLPLAASATTGCSKDDPTPTTFAYEPQGCTYSVQPSASLGLEDLALDDGAAYASGVGGTPARVRLGLGAPSPADPSTTAALTWETPGNVHGAKIRFGTTSSALGETRSGYSWTTPPPTVGFGTTEDPVHLHEVHLCGLTPATTYFYQVGGGASGSEVWSAPQTFTNLPSTAAQPLVIGVSGDSRDDKNVFQLIQLRMRDAGTALQLFSGDMVMIGTVASLFHDWLDGIWLDPQDKTKFVTLGQQYILPVAGNHEGGSTQFYGDFALPTSEGNDETISSINIGSAHVLLWDDQTVAMSGGSDKAKAQLAFLDADLAKADADRAAHPFVIIVEHRGLFSTANHGKDTDVLELRNRMVPIYDKYHVDLVLAGHDHNYERSKPLMAPAATPTIGSGTTYIVCAGAGAGGYAPGTDPATYREKNVGFGSSTPYVGVYALMTLEAKKLSFKVYGLKNAGGDDVVDSFELTH
ncbi:hypothetical protein BH09MYX1_BH09MYX1_39690 [soil metagenome]